MNRSDRPHVTAFAALSADGRVLPANADELRRQADALLRFDTVVLDGAAIANLPAELTAVWLAASAATAARHPASALLFTHRAQAGPPPPHLRIARERNDLARRLARLRRDFAARRLLCPLGSSLLPALLALDLVDELHLKLHPAICGGRQTPTLTGRPGPYFPAATRWHRVQLIQEPDGCSLVYRRE